jgi:RES domain-containing protein
MAYTSTTLTLAMAEFLAHVNIDDFDPDTPPSLLYVRATVPEAAMLTIEQIGATLPEGWDHLPAPAADAELGDGWILAGQSLALLVPSVHVPMETPERNVLINTQHERFTKVVWSVSEFAYDRRLLRARTTVSISRRKSIRGE